jgi:aspartyl-tRNA synthetase
MVSPRPEGTVNPNLPTGEVEVPAMDLEVLAEARTPPFEIEDRVEVSEELRLRHRYLDLRRPEMQRVIKLRHLTSAAARNFFDSEGFVEVETPAFSKSTPEGARDYLVPSRLYPGKFYALLQSPQLFKQLLMIAGFDRYYQLVRCFRDEDARADRLPEFTQLDVEMSFADEGAVRDVTERMFVSVFKATVGVDLERPFSQMDYATSLERFGTDKPDLRFNLNLIDLTEAFRHTEIRIFGETLAAGGRVKALHAPGGARLGRRDLDSLAETAKGFGAKGLAWVAFESSGISSPLKGVLKDEEVSAIRSSTGATAGDLILFICDRKEVAERSMGAIRHALGTKLNLIPELPADDPAAWRFAWIVDLPLVEWNVVEGRWDPMHHPFTAPKPEDEHLLEQAPGEVRAQAYDLVLNGWEVAGGSIRIHRPELQRKVFDLLGISKDRAERQFGWFLEAFDYGAPPHGGIAIGWDRTVAVLAGKDNIREVIAFPKSSAMLDILTGAPDVVDEDQLRELHIQLDRRADT